jgi:hypothetical protein
MPARKSDRVTKAVVSLLESDQEWDGPEDMALAIINEIDRVRRDKTSYVAVMQFGETIPFYIGVGPFPGAKSARNAVQGHPALGMALKAVVVPVQTPEHAAAKVKELDQQPALSGDWAVVQEDAALFKKGWDGKIATRKQYEEAS